MTIYTKIVGDLFHYGHVRFFEAVKSKCDRLVVHVVSDERVAAYKRLPITNQTERAEVIAACRYVDEVVLAGPKTITLSYMNDNNFDIYAYGYSTEQEHIVKRQDCIELPDNRIMVVDYTAGISTSDLINRVHNRL
jgi:cytidyltransferase-like protein